MNTVRRGFPCVRGGTRLLEEPLRKKGITPTPPAAPPGIQAGIGVPTSAQMFQASNSSSNAFASFKSCVSNPSVNQP
jgi:hypothetical protein